MQVKDRAGLFVNGQAIAVNWMMLAALAPGNERQYLADSPGDAAAGGKAGDGCCRLRCVQVEHAGQAARRAEVQ